MKKFLFTLAALFMVGTSFAEEGNYLYIEDFSVTPEFLAQTSGKAREMTLDVKANYVQYVSAFQVWINSPEGITNRDALAGEAMTQDGYTRTGNPITRSVALSVNEDVNIFIAAWTENDWYYPEGLDPDEDDPVAVGSVKWAPGVYNQMFTLTVRFAQTFEGGDIMVITEPACSGSDPRGECCPKDEHHEVACHVTVAGAVTPEPAPVPTVTMSDTYEVSAVCADHEVVLMINGEPVANPYQITQTYEDQSITFTAYTVANADESENSQEVTFVAEVPAMPQPTATTPIIDFVEDANGLTITIDNYTVYNITVDGVQVDPTRAHEYYVEKVYDKAQAVVVYAKNDPGTPYLPAEDTKSYNLPAKEKAQNSTPTVTYTYENGELTVTASGCTEENVTYTLYCDGVEYTGTFPIAVVAEEGYNHTWTATAVSPTTTVSAMSDDCVIEIAPVIEPGETTTYVKVTSMDQVVDGKNYIFVYEDAPFAMSSFDGASVAVTKTGDEVEAPATVMAFTLGINATSFSTSYTFTNNGTMLGGVRVSGSGSSAVYGPVAGGSNTAWTVTNVNGTVNGYVARNNELERYLKVSTYNNAFNLSSSSTIPYAYLYVEKGGEVPPVAPEAPIVTFSGEETTTMTVTVTAEEGCTLIVNGVEIDNNTYTFTSDRQDIYTAGTVEVTAVAVRDGLQSEEVNESKAFVVAQQPYATTPVIEFVETTNENNEVTQVEVVVTNATDYTVYVDGEVLRGEVIYASTEAEKVIRVVAENDPGYPYLKATAEDTYTLNKLMSQTAKPNIEVVPNADGTVTVTVTGNGTLNVLIEGYDLELDVITYTGESPYTITLQQADEAQEITVSATAQAPGELVSDYAIEQFEIEAKPTTYPETCVAPNGDYVIIDKEKALVTITNNEPGATVHYVVTLNGVVMAEGDFTGDTWEYVADGVGDWVVSCVASLPGKNDSQPGGVFFPIAENQWPTAVDEMMAGKTISNVRYFNVAGQEMQEANGTTIVVTTYTDGTKSAVKVMK